MFEREWKRLTVGMLVGFDVPQGVRHHSILVACYLLLLVGPVWQLDFV